ncbi:hypothetical protein BB560_003927 [Smittium megazygosporum]|uniref:K Homology domain-containing protein n=1 Tax=Smittium megazygosporum TaxID=133381 RepID=A0A2T9ZAQ9_9FUNG|nr:hypothetical protein BB560_003927 [Smittium megazygosporum]
MQSPTSENPKFEKDTSASPENNSIVPEIPTISYGAFEKKSFPTSLSDSEDGSTSPNSSKLLALKGDSDPNTPLLTLRALVSTKEAGIIIGKAGKNVADLREMANVNAGVSKVVLNIPDRVLSITGVLENVVKAYDIVAKSLDENLVSPNAQLNAFSEGSKKPQNIIRILISHNIMGTIIGKQGVKIKNIQDSSGARLVATKDMLPQSTERVVEIHGDVNQINKAIYEIGKCLIEDGDRGVGTVLYNPSARVPIVSSSSNPYVNNPRASVDFLSSHSDKNLPNSGVQSRTRSHTTSSPYPSIYRDSDVSSIPFSSQNEIGYSAQPRAPYSAVSRFAAAQSSVNSRFRSQSVSAYPRLNFYPPVETHTQEIAIPADMVGCIIGKAGSRITEIRKISGSRIEIAKASESDMGDRLFTITGTPESNEKALYLLYSQLEAERERRLANSRLASDLESLVGLPIQDDSM